MTEFIDPSFMDRVFNNYPVAFIIVILSSFGFGIVTGLYLPQIKHLMKIVNTLLCQIEAIVHKKHL